MDCRTFHQKLEDYLEDGLDFSGRFGLERHAQQCISCGKEMADALQLRKMASELHRVKAPANFELSVMGEIAKGKAHGRFWSLQRYWIYGFEWPFWRKVAFATSGMAILAVGIFYASHRVAIDHASAPPFIASELTKVEQGVKEIKSNAEADVNALLNRTPVTAEMPKPAKKPQARRSSEEPKRRTDQAAPDTDYVEYMMPGPDNYTVPVRLPKRIPMRYSQMSEEYFIRNVSH